MNHSPKRPNIVLIMCDQMRGDCLGIAGHPDVKTPYLDSIAAQGTRFENAYAACPSCIPARVALFTGQSQKRHGRVGYQDGIAWDFPDMIASLLSRSGYHTEVIGKLHAHPPLRACGFQHLTLHDGYLRYYRDPQRPWIQHQLAHDAYIDWLKDRYGSDADIGDTGIECNSWVAHPWNREEMAHPTNWAVTESLRFLRFRDRDMPFFFMLSFVRPHPPWDAPATYFEPYRQKALRPPAMGDWADGDEHGLQRRMFDSRFGSDDPELRQEGMAGYYASITHMDHQIGRLLRALDEEGELEDTLLLFVSDHGELLFDHGLFRKVLPYQGSVHVPLLMRVGKNLRGAEPMVPTSQALVELRDIAPTILDFAGIPMPEAMDGKSLRCCLSNETRQVREYLHGEHSGEETSNHYIVTERDKYIWFSQTGREQYFDLRKDPREVRDLVNAPEAQERIQSLRSALIHELQGREEGYTDGTRLIVGQTPLAVLTQKCEG